MRADCAVADGAGAGDAGAAGLHPQPVAAGQHFGDVYGRFERPGAGTECDRARADRRERRPAAAGRAADVLCVAAGVVHRGQHGDVDGGPGRGDRKRPDPVPAAELYCVYGQAVCDLPDYGAGWRAGGVYQLRHVDHPGAGHGQRPVLRAALLPERECLGVQRRHAVQPELFCDGGEREGVERGGGVPVPAGDRLYRDRLPDWRPVPQGDDGRHQRGAV